MAVLLPFVEALKKAAFYRRVATLFAVLFVLAHLAAAAPSPSNIEGLVYMRPDLVGLRPFLLTQPEMLLQCLLFAFGFSWLIRPCARRARSSHGLLLFAFGFSWLIRSPKER